METWTSMELPSDQLTHFGISNIWKWKKINQKYVSVENSET